MTNIGLIFLSTLFFTSTFFSQQLIINEVSQGSGSSEYVEFVVIGSPTCATPVPCIDLRKVIIDDNNGYFAPGGGTGIAAGALRFADIPFWSCVTQGTYIVIYNELSPNGSLPPDDISLTDGNCRIIIPASSNLLEMTTVNSPSTATNLYPPDISWAIGGLWATLAMSNSNDSFQIPNLAINGTPLHAVSWGNNSNGSIIYFSGSANLKVFSFVNTVSNDWNDQSNWTAGDVGVNETPGSANNTANDTWIASMNPQCGVFVPMILNSNIVNETCENNCNGSIDLEVLNGTAPYTFLWSNGEITQNISNLCFGDYTVVVTDAGGCTTSINETILAGLGTDSIVINEVSSITISTSPIQVTVNSTGGTWSSDCNSCFTSSGVFNPQISGIGIFEVCYNSENLVCPSSDCNLITVTENCNPQSVIEQFSICPEDSMLIFSTYENVAGNYSQVFLGANGCDSTHTFQLSLFEVNSNHDTFLICENDSLNVFGNWIKDQGIYSDTLIDIHNCEVVNTVQISIESCIIEPLIIYVPNSFTPNDDGTNDIFKIEIIGGFVQKGFIMNRWGNQIATFSSDHVIWDGKNSKNEMVENGIYTYVFDYVSDENSRGEKIGFVAVLR